MTYADEIIKHSDDPEWMGREIDADIVTLLKRLGLDETASALEGALSKLWRS